MPIDVFNTNTEVVGDKRQSIRRYLETPSFKNPHKIRMQSLNYVLVEATLYRKGFNELLLKCLGPPKAIKVLK